MANQKVGRNAPCPCGSGKKYKVCHGIQSAGQQTNGKWIAAVIGGALLVAALAFMSTLSNSSAEDAQPRGVWSAEHGHYH